MQYTETTLGDRFSDLILNIWKFEIPEKAKHFVHEIIPENTFSVVFINQPYYSGIRILGPQTKKNRQLIYPGSIYLGIRFNPWINISSIHGNKYTIVNKTMQAPAIVTEIFSEVKPNLLAFNFSGYHLIEYGLQRLIANKQVVTDSLAKYICIRLINDIKIKELIKEIPLSIRPVQKHFKSVTGITMTDYRNILRLQSTVKSIYLEKNSITDAAFENGYTDHAHFINTFKKYMDSTSMKDFFLMTDKISLSMD